MNKAYVVFLSVIFCLLSPVLTAYAAIANIQESPVGLWKTIDDVTGQPKSILEITDEAGQLSGRVVKIYQDGDQNKLCTACEGSRHNQRILGMMIMNGLSATKNLNEWGGGEILDPKSGKIYHCSMQLMDKGMKLKVRGYLGISLFGRSQTWIRVETDES